MKKALETLLVNVANLFKVKTILSLTIVHTVCELTKMGQMEVVAFMTLASAIVTYYFTKKEDKKEE